MKTTSSQTLRRSLLRLYPLPSTRRRVVLPKPQICHLENGSWRYKPTSKIPSTDSMDMRCELTTPEPVTGVDEWSSIDGRKVRVALTMALRRLRSTKPGCSSRRQPNPSWNDWLSPLPGAESDLSTSGSTRRSGPSTRPSRSELLPPCTQPNLQCKWLKNRRRRRAEEMVSLPAAPKTSARYTQGQCKRN